MTKQSTDYIVIDGKEHPLYSQPLSGYLRDCAPDLKFKVYGSYNWRGHVAHWKIQDGCLYLTGISGDLESGLPVTVESLFPFANGQVPALWCHEILQVGVETRQIATGRGNGYRDNHQRELLVTVESGKVSKTVQQEIESN